MTGLASSPGKLVLLIGPSGVGKSVILKALKQRNPGFHFPRSATTRARRPGESDELYHFVTDAEFDEFFRDGKFLEWAKVHEGARYGTLLSAIIPAIEKGKTVVREVDVQGFESIRSHPLFAGPRAPYHLQSIFILPENTGQLVHRITKRAPISEEELKHRIHSMEKELGYAMLCTARIVNGNDALAATVEAVEREVFGDQ